MPDGQAGTAPREATPPSELPTWNLADLYEAPDSAQLAADLDRAEAAAKTFAATYAGTLAGLSGAALAEAIAAYERIEETLGRALSYAQLRFAGDSTDPAIGRFVQSMNERATAISSDLIFFTLELNRLDDAALEAKLGSPELAPWRPWLRDLRVFRPHQLSDELEKLLHEKEVTGHTAWSRLFDETVAGMRVPLGGEDLTVSAALNKLSDRDRSVREAAGRAVGAAFGARIRLFSLITNTLAKDKEIIDTWRHFDRPESYRNRANMVEDAVVDALVAAVVADFPRLSHRYYAMKAKWLGLEKLQHWDRNAPLPDDEDAHIAWPEAKRRVLDAYGGFAPEMAEIADRFFTRGWIDAELRAGKAGGAFSHPTVPSAHPYVLLNYHGRTRDVMTLAHELGHGVHQILAADQGYLRSGTPLTLAETASVFGEMLTFRALLDAETNPVRRRIMLASKVEDMLNTVVRQIAFYRFEQRVHAERRTGELVPDRIGEIWFDIQRESLGPAFEFTPEYAVFWSYVPHFIHSPFYVYAYAFGDCLVNALYATFRGGHPGFQQKYFAMLRAGGTKRHKELLAPFGLDASDPAFWRRGLDVIAGFIDELEATA
ncbi:MAG: M3 family oligoendopeptidase [Alphaproteobacteria bacterium]|nr:M3 family oligoendopeptidase [Alphaproteobacteria bacterium]